MDYLIIYCGKLTVGSLEGHHQRNMAILYFLDAATPHTVAVLASVVV